MTDKDNIEYWLNAVHQGDVIEKLKEMPEGSVDLVISDPPYNLSTGSDMYYGGDGDGDFGGEWGKVNENWDNFDDGEYMQFTFEWVKQCKRILEDGGGIFIFGTYHNIGDVNVVLNKLSLTILNEIIWYKRNAFPNLSTTSLTASHENILWAYKGNDKNYKFNYDEIKEGKWEYDSFDKENTQVRTVWNIPNNKQFDEEKDIDHPTQKPRSVIDRIVRMASDEEDIILDPFAGSGTSLVAAKQNSRKYIGIEREEEFVKTTRNRLEKCDEHEDDGRSIFDY